MVLVDTSVWIDFFNGTKTEQRNILHGLIEQDEDVCLANIIICEVLQGIKSEADYKKVKNLLQGFSIYSLNSTQSYIEAAQMYRSARKKGITIRKTIDCLIARVAIENDLVVLHNDNDFTQISKIDNNLRLYEIRRKS